MKQGHDRISSEHPVTHGPSTAATATGRGARAQPERHAGGEPAAGEERLRMIAEAAYYRAQARNFEPGQEIEDWFQAERDIDRMLRDA